MVPRKCHAIQILENGHFSSFIALAIDELRILSWQ